MLERLNQALEYVESRLDQQVDATELARIAATSEYHLRRMFSALAGMPLSEYVRRRRLTVAGAEVLDGRESLLDIAVRYGYGSGEAFARAFRAMHGIGPGEARRTGAALVSQPRLAFRLTVEGSSSMRYRVVDKQEFRVIGFKARVPLVHSGPNQAIVDFVRGIDPQALESLAKLSDQEPQGIVAVCDDLDPGRAEGTELDYHQGVITSAAAPEGTTALAVPAGTWAVFSTSGPAPEAVQALWADAYKQWFPSNPYRTRPGPEILRTRPCRDGSDTDAELWLPVERDRT
ncbi:AraC family transcriptional regulator [Streptomyces lucensis JCM 4490]|uniref:AraC family transcriptional regulator n=1 Tax=Streptomyces lucensis JCM 4490 TaxID=1306176 RepID=A0A918IRU6_9ACTN|nr:AraC family transcriptional regulator [Streptomyces lucensis]GGW28731.1 AraC family transcriptional regulator [Streptomyces lucensis JCM 4490]